MTVLGNLRSTDLRSRNCSSSDCTKSRSNKKALHLCKASCVINESKAILLVIDTVIQWNNYYATIN
ncbi:hypothetical protein D3C76_445550 [compost metagenome]